MKYLAPLLILAIGISIGWLGKPAQKNSESQSSQAEASEADRVKPSTRKITKPDTPVAAKEEASASPSSRSNRPAGLTIPEDADSPLNAYLPQIEDMMKRRQMSNAKLRIKKLSAQLKLTPEQEKALQKAAADFKIDFSSMTTGNFNPSQLSGADAFESTLDDILSEEQKDDYEDLKKRELANRIESRALQELAQISELDLSQEQKDLAYELFYQQSEKLLNSGNPTDNFALSLSGQGINQADIVGIEMTPEGLPLSPDGPNSTQAGRQQILEQFQADQERRRNEKVDLLRPILNESQIEQYRESLAAQQPPIMDFSDAMFIDGQEPSTNPAGE